MISFSIHLHFKKTKSKVMNKVGKVSSVFLFLVMLGFSCSKTETPAPVVGCTVTFKGKQVQLPDISCDEFQPGSLTVSGTNLPNEQELTLIKSDAIQAVNFVISADPDSFYSSTFSGSTPTITIAGKTWTFSGVIENGNGDSGSISGTCNCPN